MYQKTLVIFKPDGVQRRLLGRMLERFESCGLKVHAVRFMQATVEQTRAHYREHTSKPFYPQLEFYLTSGPMLVLVLGGSGAIAKVRALVGATDPSAAAPGTIRGDWSHKMLVMTGPNNGRVLRNLIHASSKAADAAHEISVWFKPEEVLDYRMPDDELHGV